MLKDVSLDAEERCPREDIEAVLPNDAKDSPESYTNNPNSVKALLYKRNGIIVPI